MHGRALLLDHAEGELVGGRLDLVLGLQVGHALGADPVDGGDDVPLGQAAVDGLAAWSYLCTCSHNAEIQGMKTSSVNLQPLIKELK